MYKRGDFHIHSTASDGGLTSVEIVNEAKKRKVDIISITDHNTVAGVEEAILEGNKVGVRVIPGVELSTRYNNCRVHILGYFNEEDYKNPFLIETLSNVRKQKIDNIKKDFKGIINFKECKNKLSVETGIEILKFFGAVVVLAHPVLLCEKYKESIMELNFDGIEAKYFKNKDEETEEFIKYANDRGIIYTAGSDFHDYIEYYRLHGMIGDVFLNKEEIKMFLEKLGDVSV